MKKSEISKRVKEYIVKESFSKEEDVQLNTLIFEENLLNSMGFLFLMDFLKEEFDIEIDDSELVNENFESIERISSFVESKLKVEVS